MTWRRLLVLVRHLPPESALGRDLDGEGWSITDHLLATVVDLLQAANWQRSGDAKARKPKPLPRPGKEAKSAEAEIVRKALEFRQRQKETEPES